MRDGDQVTGRDEAGDGVVPPGIDPAQPSIARVYDYFLGGKDNFAVDRAVAEEALRIAPDAREAGRANRAFLRRAVEHMVTEAGIRQFLAIVHFHNPGAEHPEASGIAEEAERSFNQNLGTGRWRSREEIRSYFGDMELVEPGLVPPADWRAEPEDLIRQDLTRYNVLAGLGRKP
ncbi:hypothetical protein E1292_20470 [Nonomuraea deserti]|uniref:SAM-dependent methyltransferase n=1 Tax=Nonomuraea deserti TaxID=1848322 RepID=A0A4R4VN83_9ACTN|nr:SAM-dependent methyltransferase [Nonomuraea deserti]TDD03695.1 hypothetical protein E1292_20470 [Nonomuraea deserti]